jgi:uncharacterized membrane protein
LEEKGNHDENDDFDAHCVFHDMQVHGSSYFFASIFFYASISSWRFCGIEVWVNARGSGQVLPFVIVMIYYYFLSSNEGDSSPDKIRSQITIYASLRC